MDPAVTSSAMTTAPALTKLPIDEAWMEDVLLELLRIPSPSGRTDVVMQHVGERLEEIGLPFELTRRGAMVGSLSGSGRDRTRALVVHTDTIGCMVQSLKQNGRLAVVPVGTHSSRFSEGTKVSILTDDPEQVLTGTILPTKASGHVYGDAIDEHPHGWEHVEVRVDELVHTAQDLADLGIQVGDFVAQLAFPMITRSGFVTSRHLDDKAGVAAALAAFKAVIDAEMDLPVTADLLITVSEEVGHGASSGIDHDVAEMVSVDAAACAPGQHASETGVAVAMQDLHGPYDYHLSRKLHRLGMQHDIEISRDVFRYYRSDVASALEAGVETRAALLGFGVDATHGHERTHRRSIRATAELLSLYLQTDLTFAQWDSSRKGPLAAFPSSAVQPIRREPQWDPEAEELVENERYPQLADERAEWLVGYDPEGAPEDRGP